MRGPLRSQGTARARTEGRVTARLSRMSPLCTIHDSYYDQ